MLFAAHSPTVAENCLYSFDIQMKPEIPMARDETICFLRNKKNFPNERQSLTHSTHIFAISSCCWLAGAMTKYSNHECLFTSSESLQEKF